MKEGISEALVRGGDAVERYGKKGVEQEVVLRGRGLWRVREGIGEALVRRCDGGLDGDRRGRDRATGRGRR